MTASTPPTRQESACDGFRWIGQSFRTCDGCGQPAWDHDGIVTFTGGPFAFGPEHEAVEPWADGKWDATRAAWAVNAVWEKQERHETRYWDKATIVIQGERQYGVDCPDGGKWRETSRVTV